MGTAVARQCATAVPSRAMTIADHLDESRLRFEDVDGVSTRVYEAGSGAPLLLLHGGHYGSLYSLDCWSLVLDALARQRRVVAFDRLGQGYTTTPERDEDLTVGASLDHTAALMRRLDSGPVDVIGHSRGGLIALLLALRSPELVRRIVLVSSHSAAPPDPAHPLGTFYADLAKKVAGLPPLSRDLVAAEPLAQAYRAEQVTDDFVARLTRIAALPSTIQTARRMESAGSAFFQPSLISARDDALRRIRDEGLRQPVLILWGRDDRSAAAVLGYRLYDAIAPRTPRADLHVVNRSGHYVFRDRPQAFVAAVSAFLQETGGD